MGKRIVKNYPSPRLMETIGATNQKPAEAIGELVANSFDARIGNKKIKIVVDMRNNEIKVIDNGKGMTSEILEKAVCIGEDMSRYVERSADAKGHFGMGFKTSCSTLGKYYEIFTRPLNGNREFHVRFDIQDYSQRPAGSDAWDIEIEDNDISNDSPLSELEHGTAFVIGDLKDRNISISSVLSYLGEAFKGHLETGDRIYVIDKSGTHQAIPKVYDFVPGTKIEIDETFGTNNKYRITGWMAIDSQIHNDGLYGFNIYRHNQLVEKWDKSWFRAHLMTSRIIGEVNMDFLDATFYKQGVQQSEDWEIVKTHMKEYLKPLVTASNNLSKKGNINNPSERRKIVKELNEDYHIEYKDEELDDLKKGNKDGKKEEHKINDTFKTIVNEQSLILSEDDEIKITYFEKETESDVDAPFDYIYDSINGELQVIVFKTHPLWTKKTDFSVIKILATADSIYRMLIEKIKTYDASEANRIRNEWIKMRVGNKGE